MREVYPNPPLKLVSVELRFPVTRLVATSKIWDRLEESFGVELPEVDVLVNLDERIPSRPHPLSPVLVRRSYARDCALTLSFGALRIEFSRYKNYDQLRTILFRAIKSLDDLPGLAQISRVGLRYVNEVTPPAAVATDEQAPVEWDHYLRAELIPQLTNIPEPLRQSWFTSGVSFHSKDGHEKTFLSYGSLLDGTVIEDGALDLEETKGPCFLLDIDTFERRDGRDGWLEEPDQIFGVLDKLHENVENVFDYCVTERLKNEVFRVGSTSSDTSSMSTAAGRG